MERKKRTWTDWAMIGLALYGLAVSLAALLCDIPGAWQGSGSLAVALTLIYLMIRDRKR